MVSDLSKTCLKDVCDNYSAGNLSHKSSPDILGVQLKAEGIKKVESLVFETYLKLKLKEIIKSSNDTVVSHGWFCAFNMYGSPCYWFKLQENEDDWNSADEKFCLLLDGQKIGKFNSDPILLHRIYFDHNSNNFTISLFFKKVWRPAVDIEPYLNKLPKKKNNRGIVEYDDSDTANRTERYEIARDQLITPTLQPELSFISIQRRLINCIMAPILARQPADLDALILAPDGKLSYFEFKRKYPAQTHQYFGLDEAPHATLLRMLNSFNIGMLHLILATPYRNKEKSPVSMLHESIKDPTKASKWLWLCAELNTKNFSTPTMQTSGRDSGHHSKNRKQHIIPWTLFHLLHDNLKLGKTGEQALLNFLQHGMPSPVTPVCFQDLEDRVVIG